MLKNKCGICNKRKCNCGVGALGKLTHSKNNVNKRGKIIEPLDQDQIFNIIDKVSLGGVVYIDSLSHQKMRKLDVINIVDGIEYCYGRKIKVKNDIYI